MAIKLPVNKLVYKTNINQVYTHNIHGIIMYISYCDLAWRRLLLPKHAADD
jgi:hypothetical protein